MPGPAAELATARRLVESYVPRAVPGLVPDPAWRRQVLDAIAQASADGAAARGLLGRGLGRHLTASALVTDPAGGWALLVHHPRIGRWVQPGGHVDGDGDLLAVAVREVAEETGLTGLDVDPVPVDLTLVEASCRVVALHLDLRFLLRLRETTAGSPGPPPLPVSPEGLPLAWVALPELVALGPDDAVGRLAAAATARLTAGRPHPAAGPSAGPAAGPAPDVPPSAASSR